MKARKFYQYWPFIMAALILPALAQAESYGVQQAHVHGAANLFIVQEETELEITLETPAMNLLGFEHAPSTAEQHQQVAEVAALLTSAQQLFGFSEAQCQLLEADVEMPAMMDEHEHEETHSGHQHGHQHSAHSDVEVEYRFKCLQPQRLKVIEVKLFSSFARLETLDAQWIIAGQQGATTLSPSAARIELQ